MRRYTDDDLEDCERLIQQARARVVRQQVVVDQLTDLDKFDDACAVLDSLAEVLTLYKQERLRILKALRYGDRCGRNVPSSARRDYPGS